MTVHAGYDSIGGSCLGHAQPGTTALKEALIAKWGGTSDGIYNCRNVRGGTTKSAHAEGRAVDFHWTNQQSGQQIANALVALNAQLGIQVVIWWGHIWSYPHANEGFRPYHGEDPHHSHLHIEMNWSGATELSLPEANRVLNPPQQPDPPAAPQEDDDMIHIYDLTFDTDQVQYVRIGNVIAPITAQEKAELLEVTPHAVVEQTVYGPAAWSAITNLCTVKT